MNTRAFFTYAFVVFAGFLLLGGCSKSDDQRNFENEALAPPFEDITEMNTQGEQTTDGNVDADDWNISPRYVSLVNILTPAYPNPASYNQTIQLTIDFGYDSTINEIAFFVKSQNSADNQLQLLYRENDFSIIDTFPINTGQFAEESGVGGSDIYRIFIFDANDNLISYGDVKIEIN